MTANRESYRYFCQCTVEMEGGDGKDRREAEGE